ncbi:MAG: DUF5652 family protein [Patescibacteria group bacterium]
MGNFQLDGATLSWLIPVLFWEMIWKGFALWRSAKNNQTGWFVALMVINTFGLLPILYLYVFTKKKKEK